MHRKFLIILLLSSLFVAAYVAYKAYLWPFFVQDGQLVTLQLRSHLFAPVKREVTVEVVKTVSSLSRGLSGRTELVSRGGQQVDGLLFVFENEQQQIFWMKEMFFDIDICWLQARRLHGCQIAEAPEDPYQSPATLPTFTSPVAVDLVLETNVGFFDEADFASQFFTK